MVSYPLSSRRGMATKRVEQGQRCLPAQRRERPRVRGSTSRSAAAIVAGSVNERVRCCFRVAPSTRSPPVAVLGLLCPAVRVTSGCDGDGCLAIKGSAVGCLFGSPCMDFLASLLCVSHGFRWVRATRIDQGSRVDQPRLPIPPQRRPSDADLSTRARPDPLEDLAKRCQ